VTESPEEPTERLVGMMRHGVGVVCATAIDAPKRAANNGKRGKSNSMKRVFFIPFQYATLSCIGYEEIGDLFKHTPHALIFCSAYRKDRYSAHAKLAR